LSEQTEMKTKSGREGPSIYDLLKQDHKDVKKLFKRIVDSERFDGGIYAQIKKALKVHMAGEEKVFYPRLEKNSETRLLTLEAYEEHDLGKQIMTDIDMSDKNEEDWMFAKIKVLNEAIEMHLKEEEDDLFKKAKHVLSHEDEHEIGRLFEEEKMKNAK
jgi:hemerythrin superfamily protein